MADGPEPEAERQPRGVHNPHVVDLITDDPSTGEVVLVMLEERRWGTSADQLRELTGVRIAAWLDQAGPSAVLEASAPSARVLRELRAFVSALPLNQPLALAPALPDIR